MNPFILLLNKLYCSLFNYLLPVLATVMLFSNSLFSQDCNPIFTSCAYTRISNVFTVNANENIENETGNACVGKPYYTNFTDQIAKVKIGEPFSFNVECYYSHSNVKVWIDWNNDLIFDDNELLFYSSTSASGYTHSFIYTVPQGVVLGQHRVRVRAAYNTSDFDACSQGSYGETEDYTIDVLPAPSCLPVKDLDVVEYPNNSSVQVNWTAQNGETQWTVAWGETGFTPGGQGQIGTQVVNATQYTIENLTLDTDYEVYVKANCSDDDGSEWEQINITIVCPDANAGEISGKETLCVGSSQTLSTNGMSGGKWLSDNENVATVDENTGIVVGVVAGTVNITYQIGEDICSKKSAPFKITVTAKPNIDFVKPIKNAICKGETVHVQLKGVSSGDFSWSHSLGSGNTKNLKPTETTTYTVIGKKNGCYDTLKITIVVNPNPPTITVSNVPTWFCHGASLDVTASGAGDGATYTWSDDLGNELGTGQTKTIFPAFPPNSPPAPYTLLIWYTVTATDANGFPYLCSRSSALQ